MAATETMSPREKVEQIVRDGMNRLAASQAGARPVVSASKEADRVASEILTALASGSGSGDHAKLARLAEAAETAPSEWGCSTEEGAAFISAANPATVLALIAENAALRAQSEDHLVAIDTLELEATEAERKLADERLNYEGAMSDIDSLLKVLIRRINGEADLASAAEWVRLNYPIAAEAILSKEAERG